MAVIFDCSSSMAMFRKPYTTTSSVSFAFPPPTAVAGLIAAIVGIDNGANDGGAKAAYWKELAGTRIALSILGPTRWLRAAINFWDTGAPMDQHSQIKHQFVASPKYRVYVRGGVEERLRGRLEKGSFVYTPYLGTAYSVAQISYVGECEPKTVEDGGLEVHSVLPWEGKEGKGMPVLDIAATGGVFRELVPFSMTVERALERSINVVWSADAPGAVHVKERGSLDVTRCAVGGDDKIVAWFPEW